MGIANRALYKSINLNRQWIMTCSSHYVLTHKVSSLGMTPAVTACQTAGYTARA